MMKFSQRIMRQLVDFLNAKNISQRELAHELGVSEARVSQIFRRKSNITLKTVDEIEAALIAIINRRPLNNFYFID